MARVSRRRSKVAPARLAFIEPEAALCTLLTYHMEKLGFEPHTFSSVEEFEAVGPQHWDVVCAEFSSVPVSERKNIMRRLKDRLGYTPIIILTFLNEDEDLVDFFSLGAQDYIKKPFSIDELKARIVSALRVSNLIKLNNIKENATPIHLRIKVLCSRIDVVADSVSSLRINSASATIEELRSIAAEIRNSVDMALISGESLYLSDVQAGSQRVLPVFGKLYDVISSQKGAEMIVAGSVAGILSLGGWPAVTVYGLSMAAWMGKDAFLKAIESLGRSQRKKSQQSGSKV